MRRQARMRRNERTLQVFAGSSPLWEEAREKAHGPQPHNQGDLENYVTSPASFPQAAVALHALTLFKASWWELNTAPCLNMKSSAIPWSIQSRRQESPTAAPWRVQPCLGKPARATKLMAIPVGFLSLYTLPSLSASQNSYSQLRVIPRKMQDLLQPVGNIGREELISRETVTNHNLQRAWKQSMYQAPLCGDKAAVFLVNVVPWFKVQEILQLGLPPLTGIHHY